MKIFVKGLNYFCQFFVFHIQIHDTEDPRYNDSVFYQRFCCKIEFAVIKKLHETRIKHE